MAPLDLSQIVILEKSLIVYIIVADRGAYLEKVAEYRRCRDTSKRL